MILDYKLYLLFICSINVFEWYFKVTNYCESFFNGCVDFTMVCFFMFEDSFNSRYNASAYFLIRKCI